MSIDQKRQSGLPRAAAAAISAAGAAMLVISCAGSSEPAMTPAAPTPGAAMHASHNSADGDVKGYIDGWFAGRDVELYYTKSYFCKNPPSSGAPTGCELGANAEVFPRPGKIRTIYAIAPAGFVPDVSTLSCKPGSVCLNHPRMIDASRIAGPGAISANAVPHSHLLEERGGGWHHTVNIRVFNVGVWNQIVAAKSIETVRALQADPAVGGAGLISQDTPTNIFFFIASWR